MDVPINCLNSWRISTIHLNTNKICISWNLLLPTTKVQTFQNPPGNVWNSIKRINEKKSNSTNKATLFPSHQIEVYPTGTHNVARHFWTRKLCSDESTKAKLTMTGGVFPHYWIHPISETCLLLPSYLWDMSATSKIASSNLNTL